MDCLRDGLSGPPGNCRPDPLVEIVPPTLVMISRPAIDPAISILPIMNQLMAKVSSVPNGRQLIAFKTERECVSPPRKINNHATRETNLSCSRRAIVEMSLPLYCKVTWCCSEVRGAVMLGWPHHCCATATL